MLKGLVRLSLWSAMWAGLAGLALWLIPALRGFSGWIVFILMLSIWLIAFLVAAIFSIKAKGLAQWAEQMEAKGRREYEEEMARHNKGKHPQP